MIEQERFKLVSGIKLGTHSGIWDSRKQHNQGIGDELWLGEVVDLLNQLHEENETLKDCLKQIGYEFKKYSYEETGKKIEDYNTEKILISLLQDIINELQTDWIVANCNSDFTNDLDLRTNKVVEKNISMDIRLRRHSNWLMIGQNK